MDNSRGNRITEWLAASTGKKIKEKAKRKMEVWLIEIKRNSGDERSDVERYVAFRRTAY